MKNPFLISLTIIIAFISLLLIQFSIKTQSNLKIEAQVNNNIAQFLSGQPITNDDEKNIIFKNIMVKENNKTLFKTKYRTFLVQGVAPPVCMQTSLNYMQKKPIEDYVIFINGLAFTALSEARRIQFREEYYQRHGRENKEPPGQWIFENMTENKLSDACDKADNSVEFYRKIE